ncbi:hypothetical protein A0H81_08426 [Grifola frondosa]|uniref:Uncharacterized protein n=1 Tax=Grifola frondosa TaxID=5627 RepID=A0A1C7M901_GRIFR|nr:hypothetical protein A0H81_08426 [Grifola frondosa]
MATYYVPPRQQASTSQSQRPRRRDEAPDELANLDITFGDHSIYIFPNPPSAPPSPGSSLFSAPTDFNSSFSSPSQPSRSRSRSRIRRHNSIGSNGSSWGRVQRAFDGGVPQGSRTSPSTGDLDIDVEVWDWRADSADYSDSNGSSSWVLESEIERASRWNIDLPLARQSRHTRRLSAPRSDRSPARQQSRSRTLSRTTSIPPFARCPVSQATPHPRIHLPLLSFFATLFSLELGDPALRLLTRSGAADAEALLFPGQRFLVQEPGPSRRSSLDTASDTDTDGTALDSEVAVESDADDEPPHGLQKLFLSSFSDPSAAALRSLRGGLAVRLPVSAGLDFGVPSPRKLYGLWRAVGEVCARSSQAWREFGLTQRSVVARHIHGWFWSGFCFFLVE